MGMRYLAMAFILLLISGCGTSELVRRQYKPERAGVIKWLNQGASTIINQRREHAMELSQAFCGGPSEVLSESDRLESQGTVIGRGYAPGTLMATDMSSSYTYMTFRCPGTATTN